MKYAFPIINNIEDVLPALEGEGGDSFGVMGRGSFTIINYHYQTPETFGGPHQAMRRECRGLVFDSHTGALINRRFHKFFNIGEKTETLPLYLFGADSLTLNDNLNGVIMEKMDGSMISPVMVHNDAWNIRWISKMGITDTSMNAETFIARDPNYLGFAHAVLREGMTPIFEWCSRKNRIVIDYPEDQLVLLAIRDMRTGVYMTREYVKNYAQEYGIPFVKTYPVFDKHILEDARGGKNTEGFVIQFENGHMCKLKTDWYVSIHKAKELLGSPRRVVENAINDTLDDLLAILPPADQKNVERDAALFWNAVKLTTEEYERLIPQIKENYTRKEFAMTLAQKISYPSIVFTCWEEKVAVRDAVLTCVQKALGSDKRFNQTIPELLGDIKWTTGLHDELQDA